MDRGIKTDIFNNVLSKSDKTTFAVGIIKNDQTSSSFLGKRQNDIQTNIFEIGSVTKTFTAMLLSRCVIDGTVSLDDRIDKYIPILSGSKNNPTLTATCYTYGGI